MKTKTILCVWMGFWALGAEGKSISDFVATNTDGTDIIGSLIKWEIPEAQLAKVVKCDPVNARYLRGAKTVNSVDRNAKLNLNKIDYRPQEISTFFYESPLCNGRSPLVAIVVFVNTTVQPPILKAEIDLEAGEISELYFANNVDHPKWMRYGRVETINLKFEKNKNIK